MPAFDGVRIVEFATGIAGPYATMFFTDHGADVIKVEPPAGDPYRHEPGFQTFNRGKRSCVLDVAEVEGLQHALMLARTADVVVVDVPQVRAREIGIDYKTLREGNPSLLYLAIPPYGEEGPLRDRPSSPALISAVNGTMAGQDSYSGDPVYLVLPLAAYGTAVLAATALAAALYTRSRSGIGQFLEVSQIAGTFALQVGSQVSAVSVPPRADGPSATGARGIRPDYRLYQCADGEWLYVGCASEDFYHKLLIAIDHTELTGDARLANGRTSPEAQAVLTPLMEGLFRSRTRDEWVQYLADSDVPAQPVLTRDQFFESMLVRENGMRVSVLHPELGPVEMMGVPVVLEADPGRVQGPAPLLGAHTHEVLHALAARSERQVRGHEPAGTGMLSGVRVLDLSFFLAGPIGGRHLAMLGADVIKVEPPRGEPYRFWGLGFVGWNQGKRAIALDLRTDEGRTALERVVKTADILTENFRQGVMERLGLGYEQLRRINPRLIYITQPGFGNVASMRNTPAFDPLIQALTGAVEAQGGDAEPARYTISVTDQMQALLCTFGACAALYARERTGAGQQVSVSLINTGLAYQAAEFTRYAGAARPLRGGLDYAGPSAGERWYRCADGRNLFVEARTAAERVALVDATGVPIAPEACAEPALGPAHDVLAAAFSTHPADEWRAALDTAGVPCNVIVRRNEFLQHEMVLANALSVVEQHPQWGETTNAGLLIRASATPGRIERRAPLLAQHTREVLTDVGYDEASLLALAAAGVLVLDPPELASG